MPTVMEMAADFAKGPTRAYALIKRAANHASTSTLEEALAYEADMQDLAGQTGDYREGVLAFLEKREPDYKGG
jgi:2-(1,2-epoxy-1,2-dihydrophenyl)acetyl-CoA isomerase